MRKWFAGMWFALMVLSAVNMINCIRMDSGLGTLLLFVNGAILAWQSASFLESVKEFWNE